MRRVQAWTWLLAAALLAPAVEPAGAQRITDYTMVRASSSENSNDSKLVTVECPVGTSILGGGARTAGPAQVLRSLEPTNTGRHMRARGYEPAATDLFWRLVATAICGNVPGYERVEAVTDYDSLNPKGLTAQCPAGRKLLGGGAHATHPTNDSNIALTSSAPDGNGWYARGYEIEPTNLSWQLHAYAICGELAWTVVESSYSSVSSADSRSVLAECPPGSVVVSGGSFVGINAFEALSASDFDDDHGWWSLALEPIPYDELWTLRTDVVCPEPHAPALVAALSLSALARRKRLSARR
jgi:hypothetical protein